jgi:hypothetical protein
MYMGMLKLYINTIMRRLIIEKITHNSTPLGLSQAESLCPSWEFRKLVDLFCHQPTERFSSWNPPLLNRDANDNFCISIKDYPGIHIGENYGSMGVSVEQLLTTDVEAQLKRKYTDCVIVFELEEEAVQAHCSPVQVKQLFEKYNIMFTETKESGLGSLHSAFINRHPNRQGLKLWAQYFGEHDIKPKCIFVYNTNYSLSHTDDLVTVYNACVLPPAACFWLHCVAWRPNNLHNLNSAQKQQLLDKVIQSYEMQSQKKSFVAPIHKPRVERIAFVSELDRLGLLQQNDWSLFYNPRGQVLMTDEKVRLNAKGYLHFIEKYKHVLPKVLDSNVCSAEISKGYGLYSSKNPEHAYYYVNPEFVNKYKAYVSVETTTLDPCKTMLTEKTFKGFAQGLPTIVLSTAGCLSALEHMGFDMSTANTVGYDRIADNDLRIKKCAQGISSVDSIHAGLLMREAVHNLERVLDMGAALDNVVTPLYQIIKSPD